MYDKQALAVVTLLVYGFSCDQQLMFWAAHCSQDTRPCTKHLMLWDDPEELEESQTENQLCTFGDCTLTNPSHSINTTKSRICANRCQVRSLLTYHRQFGCTELEDTEISGPARIILINEALRVVATIALAASMIIFNTVSTGPGRALDDTTLPHSSIENWNVLG